VLVAKRKRKEKKGKERKGKERKRKEKKRKEEQNPHLDSVILLDAVDAVPSSEL
jgi:hypothetical protein